MQAVYQGRLFVLILNPRCLTANSQRTFSAASSAPPPPPLLLLQLFPPPTPRTYTHNHIAEPPSPASLSIQSLPSSVYASASCTTAVPPPPHPLSPSWSLSTNALPHIRTPRHWHASERFTAPGFSPPSLLSDRSNFLSVAGAAGPGLCQ
jgi:hypothetical protein